MATSTIEVDRQSLGLAHEDSGSGRYESNGGERRDVGSDDEVNRVGFEDPSLDHGSSATESFLGRLEEEGELSRQVISTSRQQIRYTQKGRSVNVVAAGVHHP